MRERRPSVLIADDHTVIAQGLCKLLEPHFEVLGFVTDGRALLAEAAARQPDVVMTDLSMPGIDDIEAIRRLHEVARGTRVLVLSVHTEPTWVRAAIDAGAAGYLAKSDDDQELLFAIREVLKGGLFVSPAVAQDLVATTPLPAPARRNRIRVLIVDDHPVVRQSTSRLLAATGDIEVVGEAGDGREAVAQAERLAPDVVLMNLRVPQMDGAGATRAILERSPGTRILVMTAAVNEQVVAAIRAGAMGFVSTQEGEFATAIRRLHHGESSLPLEVAHRLEDAAAPPVLTRREIEVASWVATGSSNKAIAAGLCVSEVTVRTHLRNIFEKLNISNRVELALYAVRAGWAELAEDPERTD